MRNVWIILFPSVGLITFIFNRSSGINVNILESLAESLVYLLAGGFCALLFSIKRKWKINDWFNGIGLGGLIVTLFVFSAQVTVVADIVNKRSSGTIALGKEDAIEDLFVSLETEILKGRLIGSWKRTDIGDSKSTQIFSATKREWIEADRKGTSGYTVAEANYPGNWLGVDLGNSGAVNTVIQFDISGKKMRVVQFFALSDIFEDGGITGLSSDWIKID
ncbi:MAG: hypothetical protein JKX83_03075 [Pseudomonadales bacterium]|nr:hypothetical protein [Pseudomonadales bacterium]